ncbi:VirB4 family type IV secretion system protein [Caldinitratiruptor microaerophilus]|uniref:TraG P-loop domain-containing protein n=1 Tax=Caldinitratiruptor microaerophilus TaxID=671077 RepID=A0AA35CLK9_9FIRM|nr:hypothetical protein [Caldinitratiruptor microaerophilus]BDG59772.1 hypothetical protein caldi_08620 [Caldinitratiruptor microaerophilus]
MIALRRQTPPARTPAPPLLAPGLADLIAPAGLDFERHRLTFGDQFGRVLAITGYPPKAGPAWLARLFGLPGVVGSLHLVPTDPDALVQQLNRSILEFSARLQGGPRNALIVQRTEQSLRDAQELLRKIDQEQQQVFVAVVVLLVLGRDPEELDRRTRRVEAAAAAAGMRARTLAWLQQEGLTAAGPWAWLPEPVRQAAPRHLPSETVAGAFPFVGGGLNHGSGIVFGRDAQGGVVLVNRWSPPPDAGADGPNMTVLARTRAGKSFAVKVMALREYQLGARVLFIDPEREYKPLCEKLGGSWVDVAGGGGVINPLQVRPVPREPDETAGAGRLGSPLALHLQRVRTFFHLYLRDLTDLERAALEDSLLALYAEFGVTWDTDPAAVPVWPTTRDLHARLQERARRDPGRWDRLAVLLRPAAEGTDAELWAGQTTVPEHADVIVLDVHNLHNLAEPVRRAQYFNVLGFAWDLIRRDRQSERKLLVVDEAWFLADPQVPAALDFLRELSKRIAKYNGAIVTITQNVVDFLAPEVARQGEAVIGNATYKLLLRQGERDLEKLAPLLNLTEAEKDLLASARRGEGLLIAGNQRVRVRIEAAPHELALIDPEQARGLGLVE